MGLLDSRMSAITLKTIILFYGCEVVLSRMKRQWNLFTIATLTALLIVAMRGVMENLV